MTDLAEENKRLKQWINDLQSGMYVNCVYCGYQYGPADSTAASQADVLKDHISKCPEHPLSYLNGMLKKWGNHDQYCGKMCDEHGQCTCGWSEAYAELKQKGFLEVEDEKT